MMRLANILFRVAGVGLVLLLPVKTVLAYGPDRTATISQEITRHVWAVGNWQLEGCRIITDDRNDIPQRADIEALCGQDILKYYDNGIMWLYYLTKHIAIEEIEIILLPIEIATNYTARGVTVAATDPLQGHNVIRIDAEINGYPAVCDAAVNGRAVPGGLLCVFPIRTAAPEIYFQAYAVSSYGDQSKTVELRIGNSFDGQQRKKVYGDNAYTQYSVYDDIPMRWGSVPGVNIPRWINQASREDLFSGHTYYYLGGQILLNGLLSAGNCSNNGVSGQYATECGADAVRMEIIRLQNVYNDQINTAGIAYGVPGHLIKNIIAIESQFWPGALGVSGENGLYQITRAGADTLLRWNSTTYLEICALYYDRCQVIPYDNLAAWQQDLLISHVLNDHNNIDLLAAAIKANAYQVNRLIDNIFGVSAGSIFNYTDLWKITVINYHTGPTITAAAFQQILQRQEDMTWDNYAAAMERVKPSALEYLNRVIRGY